MLTGFVSAASRSRGTWHHVIHALVSIFWSDRSIKQMAIENWQRYIDFGLFILIVFPLRALMPGERSQVHVGEKDHTQPGWTTSRHGQDSPWKSQSEWQRTEINGESVSMVRMNEWKCNDLKCVRKPTKSRLSLTHRANKSSRWAE